MLETFILLRVTPWRWASGGFCADSGCGGNGTGGSFDHAWHLTPASNPGLAAVRSREALPQIPGVPPLSGRDHLFALPDSLSSLLTSLPSRKRSSAGLLSAFFWFGLSQWEVWVGSQKAGRGWSWSIFPPILALPGLWLAMAAVSTKNPQSLTRGRLLEEQLPQISFWVTHPALVPFRLGCETAPL